MSGIGVQDRSSLIEGQPGVDVRVEEVAQFTGPAAGPASAAA